MHYQLKTMVSTLAQANVSQPLSPTPLRIGELLLKAREANTANLYIGGADVSSANGFPLAPGEALSLGTARGNAEGGLFNLLYCFFTGSHAGDGITLLLNQPFDLDNV